MSIEDLLVPQDAQPAPEVTPAETAPAQNVQPAPEVAAAEEALQAQDAPPAPETAPAEQVQPAPETAPVQEVQPPPEMTPAQEAKDVLQRLQQTIDEIPQDEFADLSRAEQGTRAHLTLESIISIDLKSPALVTSGVRLAPEVIVDTTGKIVAFGDPGQLGKAAKDFRTIDVALLKSPITNVRDLIGKDAADVIEAAIDYKTGAAQLKGVADMEKLIKAPYVKAVKGGNVYATLQSKLAKMYKDTATADEESFTV